MKTWFALALCLAAIPVFFLVGRSGTTPSDSASAGTSATAPADPRDRARHEEHPNPSSPRTTPGRTAANTGANSPSPAPLTTPAITGSAQPVSQYMPLIVTGVFGLLAIGIIISTARKPDDAARQWAFATIGTIVGFWLKQ